MFHAPDGDTDFFDTVAGVSQGDTLAQFLFIISQYYILRSLTDLIKENGLALKKSKKLTMSHRNY